MDRENKIHHILKETFGFDHFRFDQKRIIDTVVDGNDCLAIMPTGGGKSLCYQLPAMYFDGLTVVISPLISLMADQVTHLNEFGIPSCFLNSTQSYQEREDIKQDIREGKIKIVYLSPEAILTIPIIDFLNSLNISLIAIDEAHCVSGWGHEFRRDYARLGELKKYFPKTPMLALTATADPKTQEDIAKQLCLYQYKLFVSSFDRPNIRYEIQERKDELKQLNTFIKEKHPEDTGIVYCLSRKKVERITHSLQELGHNAIAYHAGLSQDVRDKHQALFNNEEQVIVVATIAFGMGIDRPDVRFVAHLDLPKSVEGYYQETGRAGRDGQESSAWMIYGLSDVVKLSQMLAQTDAHEQYKKVARFKLDTMLSLCETLDCRRKYLLQYFGQAEEEKCGNCDTCLYPVETWDATIDVQKLLSTVFKTGQMFGASHVIDVLRGSKGQKIIERGHDQLSVHGIGKRESKQHWNGIIRQLLNRDLIRIKDWDYRGLALTEKSRDILTGKESIQLRKQNYADSGPKKRKVKNLNHEHELLFDNLRILRKDLAQEYKVPPYVIFSDKTLNEICLFLPETESDFLLINGVGKSKCEKYGELFINEVKTYLEQRA